MQSARRHLGRAARHPRGGGQTRDVAVVIGPEHVGRQPGAVPPPSFQRPPLPLSAQQTGELIELLKAPPAGEGATLVHLHVRNDDGLAGGGRSDAVERHRPARDALRQVVALDQSQAFEVQAVDDARLGRLDPVRTAVVM